ncbi:MAG: hypothetical protein IKJ47_01340, partial [Oscillospiraceae bacterium]|nr:hypothetical protein [Oscillospiraceae bacterium]
MAYMVRQSIMDANQKVLGYEMRYCDDNLNATDDENAAANAVSNMLTQVGNDSLTGNKPVFL